MSDEEKLVIKKTYDEYRSQDYVYGTESSTNLNPVREVSFDQIEIIKKRLQIVTDNIIRKRLAIPDDEIEKFKTSTGNSLPSDDPLLRRLAKSKVGSSGDSIYPSLDNSELKNSLEYIFGGFPVPKLTGDLDKPPCLPCKDILKKYDFTGSGNAPGNTNKNKGLENLEDALNNLANGSSSEGDSDGNQGDSNESALARCATIELTWLKIILVVLKILKILQIIVDLVIGIIVPLIEIVSLALVCWLVPPAAEQLRQRITEMVMALIIMILIKLLQMTFNLLNLDCLCDQTLDIINQIRQALSSFNTVLGVLDINAVTALGNTIEESVSDPLDKMKDIIQNKKEAYEQLKKEYKNFSFKDMWNKSLNQALNGTVNALANDPNVGKMNKVSQAAYKLVKNDIMDVIAKMAEKKKAMKALITEKQDNQNSVDNYIKSFDDVELEE